MKKPYTPPRLVCYGDFKDVVKGVVGSQADGGGLLQSKLCWIADELYGVGAPRAQLLRMWLSRVHAERRRGAVLVALYRRFGYAAAEAIRHSHVLRRWFQAAFDDLVLKALGELGQILRHERNRAG